MGGSHDLPSVEHFVDQRGNALRVRWHEEEDVAVVSIWRGEECTATVRLSREDLVRFSTVITEAWVNGADSSLQR